VSDFVEEVEEQLRAERYASLLGKIWPWFAVALIATVLGWVGMWGYQTWRDRDIGAASITYDKALTALTAGDQLGAYNELAPIAKDGPPGYKSLALMTQAGIRLGAGKSDEAAGLYDAAAKAAPNEIFADLARLRAAQALMDTVPYPQILTRLTPLIGTKKPFDLEAREALAMAKLQVGKTQEARGDLNAISLTLGVSPAMRTRAQGVIALIDSGQAGLVGQVVHNAATMPPSVEANAARLLGAASAPGPTVSGPTPDGAGGVGAGAPPPSPAPSSP
jgi:hypothetical protein